MVTIQLIENVLKNAYLGIIRDQIPKAHPLLTLVNGYKGQPVGKYARYLHNGVETISELKTMSAKVQFSDKALRVAQNNSGATANLVNSEVEQAIQDAANELKEDLYSNLFETEPVELPMKAIDIEAFCVEHDILCILVGQKAYKYMTRNKILTGSGEFAGHRCMYTHHTPVIFDKAVDSDTLYYIPTASLQQQELADWCWLEQEDGSILRQIPGKPIYEATLVKYAKIFHIMPIFSQTIKEEEND